ncbi:MCP four helix bundle domain-containing protein, partial [Hylemonella gracilis]
MKFSDLKIGTRLSVTIGIQLLLMVAMALVGFVSLLKMNEASYAGYLAQKRVALATDWMRTIEVHQEVLTAYVRTYNPVENQRLEALMTSHTNRMLELQKASQEIASPQGREMLDRVNVQAKAYREARNELNALKQRNSTEDLYLMHTLNEQRLSPGLRAYAAEVQKLSEVSQAEAEEAATTARATWERSRVLLLLCSAIALSAGVALGLTIARSITRPIAEAARLADAVAAGDLSQRLESNAKDETG